MLGDAFIDGQFNYAPLIWVFCRKGFENAEDSS